MAKTDMFISKETSKCGQTLISHTRIMRTAAYDTTVNTCVIPEHALSKHFTAFL